MRRHEKLNEVLIDFIKSGACQCTPCRKLRAYLEQGYEVTLQLVR